jgi:glycosyltransferase involved in cell wall biosynthesis
MRDVAHAPNPPMMNKRVSVIIPSYNCEAYIEQTLHSVLAQTHADVEVLVVDDGSTDRTRERVRGFGSRVQLIEQANQGVCSARNRGFEASSGGFVCFLDHDDHWFDWKLRAQINAFEADPDLGVVFTDFTLWYPHEGVFPEAQTLAPDTAALGRIDEAYSGYIYHQFLLDCWALTSTAMIRRDVFAASGGFDITLPYSEDWDLWIRLARQVRFLKLAAPSTLYRQHPAQGNRKLRDLDYRTALLEKASRTWGLSSRDGRALQPSVFNRNLARYHLQFALHHLQHGQRGVALRSLAKAVRRHPSKIKLYALIGATLLGWKPRTG